MGSTYVFICGLSQPIEISSREVEVGKAKRIGETHEIIIKTGGDYSAFFVPNHFVTLSLSLNELQRLRDVCDDLIDLIIPYNSYGDDLF